jgi:hypothetical protein
MENLNNTIFNYRHIWMRGSADGGATWRNFLDATASPEHDYHECIYPQLTANTDNNVYLVYNADEAPGLTLNTPPDHDPQENKQMFSVMPKTDYINVNIGTPVARNLVELSEIYPNPAQGTASITVTLAKAANVSISLYNLVGQVVSSQNLSLQTGARMLPLDVSNLKSGVYFCSVKAGDTTVTKKLVVK